MPIPNPEMAAHTPKASPRSRGSKLTCTSDNVAGIMAAAPTACAVRAATSRPIVGARPHAADAIPNSASPMRNTRLRPNMSPVRPSGMSSDAKTSVYALSTHSTLERPAFSPRIIAGIEMLTMVLSTTTRNRPTDAATRTNHLLPYRLPCVRFVSATVLPPVSVSLCLRVHSPRSRVRTSTCRLSTAFALDIGEVPVKGAAS